MKQERLLLLCLLSCPFLTASASQASQYALIEQRVGDSQIALRLINRATGQTVWKKQVEDLDCVGWSPDRKALALSIHISGKSPFRLLVWQERRPARLLDDSPSPIGGGYIDGVEDIAWSPDDRRILFRVWQSGSKMLNIGVLCCLDTKAWRLSSVPGNVRQMKWLGRNRVRYQVVKYVDQGNDRRVIEQKHCRIWNLSRFL